MVLNTIALISIIIYFLIKVSIQAEILKYLTKKYELSKSYGKAWMTILIPSLIILLFSLPVVLLKLPDFLHIIIWIVFFPMLFISIKSFYKTETKISAAISIKFLVIVLILVIAIAGIQTFRGAIGDPLNPTTNAGPGCTTTCEFRYPLGSDKDIIRNGIRDTGEGNTSLTIRGYNSSGIMLEKTFNLNDLNSLKTGEEDSRGYQLIEGKLDVEECSSIEFLRLEGGKSKRSCKESPESFISNVKKILVG